MNAQISENFQGIGELVICAGDLQCSASSPELPALEHRHQMLLQPCQDYLAGLQGIGRIVYLRWMVCADENCEGLKSI